MLKPLVSYAAVMLLSILPVACMKKKPVAVLPRPPQPAMLKPAPVIPPPSDAVVPSPMVIATETEPKPPQIQVAEKPPEEPSEKPAAVRPRSRTPPPKPTIAAAETAAPAVLTPVPTPQLSELMTPAQRRQLQIEYARRVDNAKAALKRIAGQKLSAIQQETVDRIQTFLAQAAQANKTDLNQALQLVIRADALGGDLIKSLQ